MNIKFSFVYGLFLILLTPLACAEGITSSSILTEIAESSPKVVIYKYLQEPEWQVILDGIGTADDNWLNVYKELKKGSDGAAGEELDLALWNYALPQAPFKVMAITKYSSCEFGFEAECPPGGVMQYLSRLEHALEQAKTPEEYKAREQCLVGIKKTRAVFQDPAAYCAP